MHASNYQHELILASYVATFPLHLLIIALGAVLCTARPRYPTKWDMGRRILPCAYGVLGIVASVIFIVLIERAAGKNSAKWYNIRMGFLIKELGTISSYYVRLSNPV